MYRKKPLTLSFVVLFFLLYSFGLAGTTGKIRGVVKDADTGEPLPGVNVVLKGTNLGAATDMDGYFIILNIPPGTYDVEASMIGYQKVVKTGVPVRTDLATEVNFRLKVQAIEGEAVEVVAKRPMINKDETNKTVIMDFTTFTDMPIQDFDEAVAAQAGVVRDESGDLHLRGGRAGEIAYMIDGVLVQDPFYKSGGASIMLDKYVIQELQMLTGAYGAEYGQAMSGVINIVTRDGSFTKYSGRLEYESHWLEDSPYRKVDWMLSSDLVDVPPGKENEYRDALRWYRVDDTSFSTTPTPIDSIGVSQYKVPKFESIPTVGKLPTLFGSPLYGLFTGNLSGPIPFIKNLSFFVAGRYSNYYSHLPFGYDARRELNAKLNYQHRWFKMKFSYQQSRRYYKPYSHRWKYRPWALEDRQSIIDRYMVEFIHTISAKTFYNLRISRYYHRYYRFNPNRKFKISDLPPEIYNDAARLDSMLNLYSDWERSSSNSDGFYVQGDRGRYEDNRVTTYSVRFDLVSQVSKRHEIKTGLLYKYHDVWRDRWRYPWPGSAHYIEIFERYPVEFAAYAQDKMEYDRFVLNFGLRYEYFDPRATMWEDIYTPGYLDSTGQWIPAPEEPAPAQQHISPRLGIAYPVTQHLVFYTSYGHYYEVPSFYNMYKHHDVTTGGSPLLGNPKIKSQKTVQYEFGIKLQLAQNWAFDVNAYFKDITYLAGSTYRLVFPYNFTVFDNSDYASVKGIDFTLERKTGRFFTAMFNYSLSVARGNESSASDGYNYYRGVDVTLRPNREYYLDFDRRHTISLNAIVKTPRNYGTEWMGFRPFARWHFNLLVQVASGLPYTPFVEEQTENVFLERNTGRKPWFAQVDLRVQKRIGIWENVDVVGFLVVKNLFNRLNQNYVWSRTGKAWDAGPTSSYSQDRIHNPGNVGIPRLTSVGIRFLF